MNAAPGLNEGLALEISINPTRFNCYLVDQYIGFEKLWQGLCILLTASGCIAVPVVLGSGFGPFVAFDTKGCSWSTE